jgi:hypothetical protein
MHRIIKCKLNAYIAWSTGQLTFSSVASIPTPPLNTNTVRKQHDTPHTNTVRKQHDTLNTNTVRKQHDTRHTTHDTRVARIMPTLE